MQAFFKSILHFVKEKIRVKIPKGFIENNSHKTNTHNFYHNDAHCIF